jgi:hypothetical protein
MLSEAYAIWLLMAGCLINNALERAWMEAVMVKFKVLS